MRGVFPLGKKVSIAGLMLLTAGLTACGTNDALNDSGNNNNGARPIGYYSNENDADRRGDGMDHDGPVSELMEDADGRNNTTNVADRNGNQENGRLPIATDGTYSHGDMNYHNHMTFNGYEKEENKRLAAKIANRVKQVNDVSDSQVMVTDDRVIIAVRSANAFSNDDKNQVEKAAQNFADGRSVQVLTDNGTFTRLRNMHNR
ncbi:sporulation protein [Bacillus atrophaeus]|nr:Sporulation cortex protein CoxA [Bacillus atrophaeus]ASS72074.1 sporulation protein [Bacillus atrophaeus]ATO28113.1 sporulation protein [Bacillus atrophaeus]PRR94018.1 sporulation protein [Bacillus atrophaeus]PSA92848.1 sporulation protein [Bacillus atrophaeus]